MTSILIVDDDIGILETLQYLLLNEGYQPVTVAKDGQDAINQYRETKPDMVLMDIKMPIMNGFNAFFKIKEFDEHARVVLTSSYAVDNEEYQHAKNLGIVGMLSKPFTIEKILKVIEKCQK